LFWTFFKYVEALEPTWVLMENVPDLLVKKNGYFLEAIAGRFKGLGYQMSVQVLNAAEYGVPQLRRRAFFLARKGATQPALPFPKTTPGQRALDRTRTSRTRKELTSETNMKLFESGLEVGPSVWDAISDLSGSYPDEFGGNTTYATEAINPYQRKMRGRRKTVSNHFPWPLTPLQRSRVALLKPGQGQDHLPPSLQVAGGYGSAYRRLDPDAVALTLTTWLFHPGSGMFTHPFENRVLTIREAARIQSFSDGFEFIGRYHSQARQVGNAVAPLVAEAIGDAIKAQS
jgi:DNA (cytosine-5)-methyltransferase 1